MQIDAPDQSISVAGFARDLMRSARVRPPFVDGQPQAVEDQELIMVLQPYAGLSQKPLFHLNVNRPGPARPARVRSRPAYRLGYRPPVSSGGNKVSA